MIRILLPLFLLFASFLLSQSKVDSLLYSLETMGEDSLKVQTYLRLTLEYNRIDQNIALSYVNKAQELAKKLGLESGLAESIYRKGNVLRNMNLFDQAMKHYLLALSFYERIQNSREVLAVKTEMGRLAQLRSNNEIALEFYLEALSQAKQINDKNGEARIHNYIGEIYKSQKQYRNAIYHYELALSLVEEINFKPGISACLNNLGAVHVLLEEYEQAIDYNERALKIKKETGDKLGESRVLGNLAKVYRKKEQYDKVEKLYQQAYRIAKEVDNRQEIANIEFGLAENAFHRNDYEQCIVITNKIIADLHFLNDSPLALEAHKLLSKVYEKTGNFKKAYDNAILHNKLSDSLYSGKILTVTNELEAKYQNEQKSKEIALLAKDNDIQSLNLVKRENERNGIILFSLVLLVLVALSYNQFRIKQKANEKLRELDRLKSNFFANISHEFRTPLTLIKGPIEQLEQNPDETLSAENVKMIRRNTNRILKMVNQLLDLSKVAEGTLKLELTEGNVYKCLRAAAASFNSHAAQRNIDYKVQIPQCTLWASFDRDKLENIVYNLLGNAFKFSEDGSIIVFEVNFGERGLFIQVSDSGKGIPKESLPFVFDRFYQVDGSNTREKEGTGIGLSLSKDFVELMDGTITVSSEVGKGTFFTVLLQLQEIKTGTDAVLQAAKIEKATASKSTYLLSKIDSREVPRVLLIEDNSDMRHFIQELLLKYYKVEDAINGNEGLKKAIANPPDLIITDLMMPKMDGITLCKKLKNEVQTSHVPIIMLTAKAGIQNKLEGLETGADDYLTKPFDGEELLVRAKNLIVQRKKLRDLFTNKEIQVDPKKVTVNTVDQIFLENVLELLEANFLDSDFGVPQMQKSLAMSKTQLYRKLKALTNESPGELLRNFRLKRAAQLLSQKADSVTQIAYKVGFNNLSYFAKCFKELYGVAPSSY